MICLTGVTVKRERRALLDGVDLQVRPGEMVLVEGGRGAGKSTLLDVAAALTVPDAGQVWIGGRNVTGLRAGSLPYVRRNIGYLPSDTALLPRASVVENVALALAVRGAAPATARAQAARVLDQLGVATLALRRIEHLSAGERRLVCVARALVGNPPLLVLDEPTTALAAEDAAAVLGAMLAAAKEGAALLCASADLLLAHAMAQVGGRRVTLAGGRLDASMVPGQPLQLSVADQRAAGLRSGRRPETPVVVVVDHGEGAAVPVPRQLGSTSDELPVEVELAPVETMGSVPLMVEVSLPDDEDDEADDAAAFELAAARERVLP